MTPPHEEREGFVGTPGPARWCRVPARVAAEYPPPELPINRVSSPKGLQTSAPSTASAGAFGGVHAWLSEHRLCSKA